MSSRERNLLILLIAMAFIVANFLAYSAWYQPKMEALETAKEGAERKADFNEAEAGSLDLIQQDREWLERFEPQPTSAGKAATRIQQLAESEAVRSGLTIKRKDFGDQILDPALTYHRVRYQIEVSGAESSVYRWLDRLHSPNEFRAVTYVRLNPQRDDATRAECEVYIDQWFLPEGGGI